MNKLPLEKFPVLNTIKLILRKSELSDENEIYAIRSDETVAKYLDRPLAKSIEDAREFINRINNGLAEGNSIYWVIAYKDNNKFIGSICLWNISAEESKAEIGFELLPEFQGKGIMQEVIPVVIKYGFEEMQLKAIEGEVAPDNIKSIKLMEKYGFTLSEKLEATDIYTLCNKV